MISVMALLDRNYIRQTTVRRGNAVVKKSISSAPFFTLFFITSSQRHHQMSARNVGSVCSYGTISQHMILCSSKPTSVSVSHRNNFFAYFKQGDPTLSSVMTSERKCECLTFLPSVLVCTDAILIVSAHQSAYKAEILTQSMTNSIWCQNLMA